MNVDQIYQQLRKGGIARPRAEQLVADGERGSLVNYLRIAGLHGTLLFDSVEALFKHQKPVPTPVVEVPVIEALTEEAFPVIEEVTDEDVEPLIEAVAEADKKIYDFMESGGVLPGFIDPVEEGFDGVEADGITEEDISEIVEELENTPPDFDEDPTGWVAYANAQLKDGVTKGKLSKELGVSRPTLNNRMKKYA